MEDENRYTRLKSLSEFGLEVDWLDLAKMNVLIIGVGGVGSVAAEMLARCGVGELNIIDLDYVEEVNLNRLFYTVDQIGQTKVKAAEDVLKKINSDVEINGYFVDVCSSDFEEKFDELINDNSLTISCLDNLPARLYVNSKCVELNRPYVDSGATRSGLGGYVHLVKPRENACYACTGSIDLGEKKEGKDCTASLPSTIAIVASFVTEISLKYLLKFGTIPDYIGFNALTDHYLKQTMPNDPNCHVCGDKIFSKKEKKQSFEKIEKLTEGKELSELMEDLEEEIKEVEE